MSKNRFEEAKNNIPLFEWFSDVRYATEIINEVSDLFSETSLSYVYIYMSIYKNNRFETVAFDLKSPEFKVGEKISVFVPLYRKKPIFLQVGDNKELMKFETLEEVLRFII